MEEARRFFRYVIPGLVFVIVVLATFFVADHEKTIQAIKKSDSIGNVLGLFVISGGVGYIFSNIYFYLYWSFEKSQTNHMDVMKSFDDILKIVDVNGDDCTQQLDRKKCWVLMNVYWHSRLKDSKRIEGINIINDKISDLTHGIGTSTLSIIFAMYFCLYFFLQKI